MSAGNTRPCLIVAVDLDRRAAGTLQRAARMARFGNLDLVVVHVVEHHTGFESDHVPFATPTQLRAALGREARARLAGLVHHLGLAEAEIVIGEGRLAETLAALAAERRARLVITGSLRWGAISKLATLGEDSRLTAIRCDVLHAGSDGTGGLARRLSSLAARWLAGERHNP